MTGWWLLLPMRSVWYQILAHSPSQRGQRTKTNSQPQNIQTWSILKQYIIHQSWFLISVWQSADDEAGYKFLQIMLTVIRQQHWGVTLISFCGLWPQPDVLMYPHYWSSSQGTNTQTDIITDTLPLLQCNKSDHTIWLAIISKAKHEFNQNKSNLCIRRHFMTCSRQWSLIVWSLSPLTNSLCWICVFVKNTSCNVKLISVGVYLWVYMLLC